MKAHGYLIADEPRPSGLSHLTVAPVWPLLAAMFGPATFAWGWSLLNGLAIGSPTKKRELAWVIGGVIGGYAILIGMLIASRLYFADIPSKTWLPYAMVVAIAWKLIVSYRIHLLQSRVHEIYVYFDGVTRNGLPVVIGSYFLKQLIFSKLSNGAVLLLLPLL